MFRSILAVYREAFSGLNRAVWLLALTTLVNRPPEGTHKGCPYRGMTHLSSVTGY